MIAKFSYDSEKNVHRENFAGIAKFSLWLRNFHNPCKIFTMYSKNPAFLQSLLHCLLHPVQHPSLQFFLTFLHPGLIKSLRILNIRHRYETKLEIMTESRKTCKITKNKLETKSVVLSGRAHVNWLNSHD